MSQKAYLIGFIKLYVYCEDSSWYWCPNHSVGQENNFLFEEPYIMPAMNTKQWENKNII